jgi:hypothetical protein
MFSALKHEIRDPQSFQIDRRSSVNKAASRAVVFVAVLTSQIAVAQVTTVPVSTAGSPAVAKKTIEALVSTMPAPPDVTKDELAAKHEIAYSNVWADDKGQTHISQCLLKGLKLQGFAPPAAPYYFGFAPEDIKSVVFAVAPVGWYGDWHHAPGPQWVIDLSGAWEVKTADGKTLRQGPGEFQFNSDESAFASKPGDKVGHTARQVGDVPNVRVIITLKKKPGKSYANQACVL